jgi:hypothetical protein
LLSDLLPGFNVNLVHELFRGDARSDTAHFDPFLENVSANFTISPRTFRPVLALFGLAGRSDAGGGIRDNPRVPEAPSSYLDDFVRQPRPGAFQSSNQLPLSPRGGGFSAAVNYTLQRTRVPPGTEAPAGSTRQNIGLTTGFSPTAFWSLSWTTQYNLTDSRFDSQSVRLERDLHEWRAGFSFVKNANGNFAFYFSIFLTDLPELRFDYDQTTFER